MDPRAEGDTRSSAPSLARAAIGVSVIAALAVVVWTAMDRGPGGSREPAPAPAMEPRPVPPFRLTDQEGKPFGLDDLKGKVWIANFMFSRCSATCPGQAAKLGEVARELAKTPEAARNVRLVSFSVDSKNDTPEVLKSYAESHGASSEMWRFLAGSGDEVARLSREAFQLGAEVKGDEAGSIVHSDRFVLVDPEGRIRGFYRPTTEPEDMERLLTEARQLAVGGAGR